MAALQGKSIKQYTVERLFPVQSGDDQAWQELKTILGKRIVDGLAGAVADKDFDAIVDEELGRVNRD